MPPGDRSTPPESPAAPDPDARLRVLVVAPLAIWPPIHGGGVRITNLVRRLARRHDVSLLLVAGGTDAPEHRAALVPPCREVQVHPAGGAPDLDPEGRWPEIARPFASRALADRVRALVHGRRFDVVQLEYTELGGLVEAARPARVVLVEHDLSYRSHRRRAAIGRPPGADHAVLERLERFELEACRRADQVHVMSEHDRAELCSRLGGDAARVAVVPNGVDTDAFRPPEAPADRRGVLLLGSFPHAPNLDAFDWTLAEVWPAVRRRLPEATLTVAGARPPERVLAADGRDGLRVAGEVDDVRPLLRGHHVLLVPLRAGSGTRLKIVEALACGLPVVSTTIGAEGLPVRDGVHLLLADDPGALADAVARVHADPRLAARLAAAGRELAERELEWDAIAARVDTLWRSAVTDGRRPRVEAAAAGPDADVAVVVPVLEEADRLDAACRAVEDQEIDATVDRVLVEARPSTDGPPPRPGWRTVVVPPGTGAGPALDAAIRSIRASSIALLSADSVPADDRWLARLVAPFASDRPPAAVQGGVWDQAVDGGPRVEPAWTADARRWRDEHDGVLLDLASAAVRRDVWERAPFGPWDRLAALRWQRIAAACGWLVLPCWDAAVVRVRRRPARWWWREALHTGRELRSMGRRYSLADAILDLTRPGVLPHRPGWPGVLAALARRMPVGRIACLRPTGLAASRWAAGPTPPWL